jgi:hypothetical protein
MHVINWMVETPQRKSFCLYSEDIRFEHDPGYLLSRLKFILVNLIPSKQILEGYLQLGHDRSPKYLSTHFTLLSYHWTL